MAPLVLATVSREQDGHVLEGILECPTLGCRREYPILEGLPLLLADLRGWVEANLTSLLARDDLGPEVASLLGDCLGPTSPWNSARQHLSTYAESHYDSGDSGEASAPGSIHHLLDRALALAPPPADGPILDLGCAVGGTTFGLAFDGREVLGGDLHPVLLRCAGRLLREGRIEVPRRRVGCVYDPVEIEPPPTRAEKVDFWLIDAVDLPFADATFGAVAALNLLDCVRSPLDTLREIGRVLRPGGVVWLASPYDWSVGATPFEGWIGGHSQRGADGGAAEPRLRSLLTPEVSGLELIAEERDVPWRLRLHARGVMEYQVDLVVARRVETGGARESS